MLVDRKLRVRMSQVSADSQVSSVDITFNEGVKKRERDFLLLLPFV